MVTVLVVAMSIFLMGALGLAIDGAQMYAHWQMAQTAADAGALAGMMSIMNGTNATSPYPFGTGSPPASFTCSTTDSRTPCVYVRNNGFGSTAADTVTVSFPVSVAGASLSSDFVPAIMVTVQRTRQTGLIRFLGPATSSVTAKANGGIASTVGPIPLLVTHPTLADAISTGAGSLRVCGGTNRSIQINSSSATAATSAEADLSHAGPADSGDCSAGTGADFGVFGGPAAAQAGISLGSTGHYRQPSSPVTDPYAGVAAPAVPAVHPAITALADGVSGCPAAPKKACKLYSPGLYTGGIDVKNETAVFKPGLYYIDGGGFKHNANGHSVMSTGFADDPDTGQGMVVYNTGIGILDFGANSSANLVGSANASVYKGLLFFEDRNAVAQTHALSGGGGIVLTGSLYLTNPAATMLADASHYQGLSLAGNSTIQINGLIVVGTLSTGGTANVTFNLAGAPWLNTRSAALVK